MSTLSLFFHTNTYTRACVWSGHAFQTSTYNNVVYMDLLICLIFTGAAYLELPTAEISVPDQYLVSPGARAVSAATLVAVSHDEGVDVWGRPKVFTSLICHLYSVTTPGAGVRMATKKTR